MSWISASSMRKLYALPAAAAVLAAVQADAEAEPRRARSQQFERFHGRHAVSFQRIATVPNYLNNSDLEGATVSEIITANESGKTLVYTDGLLGAIGLLDITDPRAPQPAGKLDVGGEPTSVAALGEELALVAVNTSDDFSSPSGHLAVVDLLRGEVIATVALDGQPDSVAISPSGRFAAVVIENERDEELVVNGLEGGLPQEPSGSLAIVDLAGRDPLLWRVRKVDLTGLSSYAPEDAEPEFVDINAADEAVVSLQENNHIAIVDLRTGQVTGGFSAGNLTLDGVDATDDGVIALTETLFDVPREPDAVTWIPARGGDLIATANEGDLLGGSRGFSIFDRHGRLRFDSGRSLDELAVRHGHYPESRSDNKGTEPEAVEYARFGGTDYLFVASERGGFVAVYEVGRNGQPQFVQLLPAPFGPEGVLAVPARGLLVVSGEEDDPSFGVRSSVMIYELGLGRPSYPQLVSGEDDRGEPIAWGALSGMVAVPERPERLLAVWDSYYAESKILTLDVGRAPARITSSVVIQGGSAGFDPEGIAIAPDGSLWIASEGNSGDRPNLLLHTDPLGVMLEEVALPEEIEACRAASSNRATLGSGFEGVAVAGSRAGYSLLVAQQRGWDYTTPECEALDDDLSATNPAEPAYTRLWTYDPTRRLWTHIAYELEPVPENASWVGLSEITAVPGGYIVIERDNRSGDFAQLKTLVRLDSDAMRDGIVSRAEKARYDLLPALRATNGWISDKPEGVAVNRRGELFVVTDNDGVEDWSGETWFLRLGSFRSLFRD